MSKIYAQDIPYNLDFAISNNSIDISFNKRGFLEIDDRFDLVFATDYDELVQRIIHCIITKTGEIPHRVSWGVGLNILQNAPENSKEQAKVASAIRSQLGNSDFFPEVTAVNEIVFNKNGDIYGINVKVSTIYGEIKI